MHFCATKCKKINAKENIVLQFFKFNLVICYHNYIFLMGWLQLRRQRPSGCVGCRCSHPIKPVLSFRLIEAAENGPTKVRPSLGLLDTMQIFLHKNLECKHTYVPDNCQTSVVSTSSNPRPENPWSNIDFQYVRDLLSFVAFVMLCYVSIFCP